MAQILFSEVLEEAQLATNDVLGTEAKFTTPTVAARLMTKAANRIMPALPQEILDDDVLGYVPLTIPALPPRIINAGPLTEGTISDLPDDLNGINSISVMAAHEQIFIHPSYASFRGAISKMSTPIDNMEEWHFCKHGSTKLLYWPVPSSDKGAVLSYIKKVPNPEDVAGGYFLIPEQAVRPVVMAAVAWFKLADLKPDQMQMLQMQASRDLLTLIGVERLRRVLRDVNISQKFIDLLLGQIQL